MKIANDFLSTVDKQARGSNRELAGLEYNSEDIRHKTLSYVSSTLLDYYLDVCSVNQLGGENSYLNFLTKVNGHPTAGYEAPSIIGNMINGLNRKYIIDIWMVFEAFITSIFESEVDELTIESYQNAKADAIIKRFKDLSQADKDFIYKKLRTPLIPFDQKLNKIYKLIKDRYSRDINADKEFLKFFYALRNGQHMNFVFRGREFEYKFQNTLFIFRNNLPFNEYDLTNPANRRISALMLRFEFILKFKKIIEEFSRCIQTEFIKSYVVYGDYEF